MSIETKRRAMGLAAVTGFAAAASQVFTLDPYLPLFWAGLAVGLVAVAWMLGADQ